MRVRAKQKIQMKAAQQNCQITYSAQEGSKWNAYYEPDFVPDLPWRVQHRFTNVRITEERFRELFEEVSNAEDQWQYS